jgi:hypothetical protein
MAIVKIVNLGNVPQKFHFLNHGGNRDSGVVLAGGSALIDETLLLSSVEELKKRNLEIQVSEKIKEKVVTVEIPKIIEPPTVEESEVLLVEETVVEPVEEPVAVVPEVDSEGELIVSSSSIEEPVEVLTVEETVKIATIPFSKPNNHQRYNNKNK